MQQQSLHRLPAVVARTGLKKTTLYKLVRTGQFPPPVRLNERAVAWLSSEIDAWIESLPRAAA